LFLLVWMTFLMSNIWWLSQYGIFLVRGISVLYHCLLYIMHHKRIQYSIHDSKSSLSWDFPYEENWMFGRVMWFNPSCFCLHYSFFPINKLIFNILNCLLTWRGFLMTTSFENLNSLYTYGTNLCLHLTFISDFFCFFLKIWGWNKDTRWVALCRFWISFLWCMWLEKNVFFEGPIFYHRSALSQCLLVLFCAMFMTVSKVFTSFLVYGKSGQPYAFLNLDSFPLFF